jgi:hypothetical protein
MYNTNERGLRNPNHPNAATTGGAPGGMTYGQSAASGPAPTTAGHHKHDILNKLDPRIDSTRDRQPMAQTGNNIPEGTYGPHSSRLANALDPRVDSDLDSTRAGAGMGPGGGLGGQAQPAAGTGGGGMVGGTRHGAATTGYGAGYGAQSNAPEGTYGPHSSRLANTLDPRVDSDRDRHVGPGATHAPGAAMGGRSGVAGAGGSAGAPVTDHHAGGMGTASTAAGGGVAAPHTRGPHKSDLLNKLDPRVDSTTGAYKGGSGSRGAY